MEMNNALWLVLAFFLCLVTSQVESRSKSKDKERSEGKDRSRSRGQHQRLSFLPPVSGSSKKPNIILVLTDDQDVVLGKHHDIIDHSGDPNFMGISLIFSCLALLRSPFSSPFSMKVSCNLPRDIFTGKSSLGSVMIMKCI